MELTKQVFLWTLAILILTLGVIAYLLYVTKKKYIYPPYVNECPDYYYKNSLGECYDKNMIFFNSLDKCYKENFNKNEYNVQGRGSNSGLCKKKQWADKCNILWDGITNNTNLCI